MNYSFKYSYFPTAWKQPNVISIIKPGRDPSDPNSYKPISLLNALGIFLFHLINVYNQFKFFNTLHLHLIFILNSLHQCKFSESIRKSVF
jgi:hypothetical protein